MRVGPPLLIVVFLLLAGACSSTATQPEPSGADAALEASEIPPSAAPVASPPPGPLPEGPLPFDAVLLEIFGTTDTQYYRDSLDTRASELAIACMEAAGFELQITLRPPFAPPDPTNLDDAREIGFGIIAEFRHRIEQNAPLRGPDPNVAYLQTLTSAEIETFFQTLDGVPAPAGQAQTDTGCNGTAATEAVEDWDRFAMALPNFTALGEERDTHPQWVAARSVWQGCMSERGFAYGDPTAIRSDVVTRMRATVNEAFPGGQVGLVPVNGELVFDPQADILLADLLLFERDAAVANIECREPLADQFVAAEFAVQQAFVDRNRAAIDQLLGDE